jgi:hypothetical protein
MAVPADPLLLAIEAAGWIGALLILAAYGLVSSGRLDPRAPTFQWMNLAGAAGFVVNSGWHGAWPSAILNIIWIGIAAATLIRIAAPRA